MAPPTKRDVLGVQQLLIEELDIDVELFPNMILQLSDPKVKQLDFRVRLVETLQPADVEAPPDYLFIVGTSKAPPKESQECYNNHVVPLERLLDNVRSWSENFKLAEHNRRLAKRGVKS